ncbi:tyrosine-type recombinase/integrase [Tritonibacter mobilis]|uniref:tyrosine-type recombinase/integrase n=1 Tax=Tritonibacter mobilis TaxID=379347 RepID=UPI000806D754|nr:tyrosine-type recombinase/integrase [Tritonibacter mobilis]GLP87069.1 integrase [Tritonibacter mobilis]SDW49679.1 Site-specific recombinase XerD [Tritonibacter mobilis]
MATFRKTKTGWRAEVARAGVRASKVFPSKREAQDWASRKEYEILNGSKISAKMKLRDLFERYAREVSSKKRGYKWEALRLNRWGQSDLGEKSLSELSPADFAAWRDGRLLKVAPSTVRREMTLMGSVFSVARREWGLIGDSPLTDVRKPQEAAARDRLPTSAELERLELSAGNDLKNATTRAFHAFLFAGETAMRAGEIVGMKWEHIDLERRVVDLPMTKNGTSRQVPLSRRAVEMLEMLPESDPVFALDSRQLDVLWRKVRDRAAVEGLTFHDSRHWAITQLAKKLDVMDLARMVGHRNVNQLLTYYNERAEDLAKRLDC